MTVMSRLASFRALTLVALVLCAIVVVLGAYVRLTDAGLGCPDWPTCYGHVSAGSALENREAIDAAFPGRPFHYGKALREMTHRYAASTLGLIVVLMTALAWVQRREGLLPVRLTTLLLVIVVAQGILGMLTVTWLLKPLIVTLHLLGGMTTLALLWWLWLTPATRSPHPVPLPQAGEGKTALTPTLSHDVGEGVDVLHPRPFGERVGVRGREKSLRPLAIIGLVVLAVQIALGGWTSSNYAAVACPDFPTCQGSWWPAAQYDQAFVLWRGLGIDYEGGVLDHPARVAVHFTHRLGALVTTLVLATLALLALRRARAGTLRLAAVVLLAALALQLAIGITTVVRGFPLAWATAHNAGAALLLLGVVAVIRFLWPGHAQHHEQ
jgi:cytochrome c oxidase assembly protein subunit 15